ncbi:MAG: LysM peptidoglycan-binding domain-containing protein [Mesorhizobium sp.]|nr:LysM peptidoglycan-binding domain-containing protein [Mesorhizobium sp.]
MIWTPLKALLVVVGGSAAAVGAAYVTGALDRFLIDPPATLASLPSPPSEPNPAEPKAGRVEPAAPVTSAPATPAPAAITPAAAPPAADVTPAPAAAAPATPAPATPVVDAPAAPAAIIAPTFDVVRVESGGSIVIAGKAARNAKVEILTGSKVIGLTAAGPQGDFAVVLDDPLKPGDYQIVLRSTTDANVIAMSPETAVVSIPETASGQVLALVEQPGQPSKLITVPEPVAPQAGGPAAPAAAAPETPAVAAADPAVKPDPAPATQLAPAAKPAAGPVIKVEAVEIEGNKVFVAGVAEAGSIVRVYANDLLLGETKASDGGRFLVEALRELPVGGYIIRADLVAPDGIKVIARAAVPFEREAGQSVAAVASSEATAPNTDSSAQPAEATAPKPTETVAAADQPAETAARTKPVGTDTAVAPAQPVVEAAAAPEVIVPAPSVTLGAGAPAITAPALQSVDSAVIIRRGDTLWRISRRVYGMGVRYSTIYLANQDQISNPDKIWPGQVFKVPETTGEGEKADMKAVSDQTTAAGSQQN